MREITRPLPYIDEENTPYWEYCKKHELRLQECKQCGHIRASTSIICPKCNSLEYEWTKLSGKGKVFSFVIYRRAFHPAFQIPYNVAIIELVEGPRIQSNVVGIDNEKIKIDMPVKVCFEDLTDEVSLPKFEPA